MSNVNQDRWDYQGGQNQMHDPQKDEGQKSSKKNHYNKYKENQNVNRGRDDKGANEYVNEHQFRKHMKQKVYNKNGPQDEFQEKNRSNDVGQQNQMYKKNKKKQRRDLNGNNVEGLQLQNQNYQTYENNNANYEKDEYIYDEHQKKNGLQINNPYMNTLQNQPQQIKNQKENNLPMQMNTMPNQSPMNPQMQLGNYNMGQGGPSIRQNQPNNQKQKKNFYHNSNELQPQVQMGQFNYYENPQSNNGNKQNGPIQGFNPLMQHQFQYKGGFNNGNNNQNGNSKFRDNNTNKPGIKMGNLGYGFQYNGQGNNNQLMMTNSMMQIQGDQNMGMPMNQSNNSNTEAGSIDKDYLSGEEDSPNPFGNKNKMYQQQQQQNLTYPKQMQNMRNLQPKNIIPDNQSGMNIIQKSNMSSSNSLHQINPNNSISLSISSENQSINTIGQTPTSQGTSIGQSFISNRSEAPLPNMGNYPAEMYKPQFMPNNMGNMGNMNEMLLNPNYVRMSMFGIPMGLDQNGMFGNFPFPNYQAMNQAPQMKYGNMDDSMMKQEKKNKGPSSKVSGTPNTMPNTNPLLNPGNMKMHMGGMMPIQYMKQGMNLGNIPVNQGSKGSRSNQGIKNTIPQNFSKGINLNFITHQPMQSNQINNIQNIPLQKQQQIMQNIQMMNQNNQNNQNLQNNTLLNKNHYKKIPYKTINSDKNINVGGIDGLTLKPLIKQQNQNFNPQTITHNYDNGEYISSHVQDFQENDNQNVRPLFTSLKLKIKTTGSDDEIKVNLNEDLYAIAKKYISKKKMDQFLIEPLCQKIENAIEITNTIFHSKLSKFNIKNLTKVRDTIMALNKYEEEYENEKLDQEEDYIESDNSMSLIYENETYEKHLNQIRPSLKEIEDVQLLNNSM